MKLQVVSIRDSKAEAFGQPNYVTSTGVAVRAFADEINRADAQNVLYRHPDDFVLFHLGSFDDQTGEYEPLEIKRELSRGREVAVRNGE